MSAHALPANRVPANRVPRGALIGAACLIAFTLVAAFAGRMTGLGTVKDLRGSVAESRDLRFEDGPNGEVIIWAARDGRIVDVLAPRTNHFVRERCAGSSACASTRASAPSHPSG